MNCIWRLEEARHQLTRKLALTQSRFVLRISETVENLSAHDYPLAWTQHVTLGPPFLQRGTTEFRIPDVYSMSLDGKELRPEQSSTFTSSKMSGGFITHLIDPSREQGYFLAYEPRSRVLHGYVWKRSDFPWIGIWEENHLRQYAPWNGEALARGMEFGVSPFPESRKDMVRRGELFGTPCYRWIAAKSAVTAEYCAFLCEGDALPSDVVWNNDYEVGFD